MFAASQFASVQYGSITMQVVAGYFVTAFESISLDDTTKIDALFRQIETVVLNDTLTIIGITTSTIESFKLIDSARWEDPNEGIQIGDWRRVPKTTGVWTPIAIPNIS